MGARKPHTPGQRARQTCSVDGCGHRVHNRNLCYRCFRAAAAAGTLPEPKRPCRICGVQAPGGLHAECVEFAALVAAGRAEWKYERQPDA